MADLGKYQLVKKLASGGMAEVYLARAAGPMGFEKTLVVKRILPHLAEDPVFVQMFLSEAKLAAQLNHPNVVQLFDFGEADGQYFIAMEYIDGLNLRRLNRRAQQLGRTLPYSLVAKTVSFAAEGLAYAHDFADPATGQPLGLIHRDVSPDNILLGMNGGVKVVDFGIAKAANQTHHTQTGMLKGKVAYMPPEQLRGKALDRRADVFALGMVLYELVTGTRPFDAATDVAIMQAIMYEPFVPASARRPDVPATLQNILDRALAKDRAQRYPDCRALQADLERFIVSQGEPVSAYHLARLVTELATGAVTPATVTPPPAKSPVEPVAITPSKPQIVPVITMPATTGSAEPTVPDDQLRTALTTSERAAPRRARAPAIAAVAALLVIAAAGAWMVLRPDAPPHRAPVAVAVAAEPTTAAAPSVTPAPEPKPEPVAVAPEPTTPEVTPSAEPEPVAAAPAVSEPPSRRRKERPAPRKAEPKTIAVTAREPAPSVEPAVAAAPQLATFRLESSPPGQVRVNGKFVGATPVQVSGIQPGEAVVEVYDSRVGFKKAQTFNLAAGDNGTKRIVAGQGKVEFRVRPFASVFLDDRPLGQTPFAAVDVYEGTHTVRMVNQELSKDVSVTYEVKPGANVFKYNLGDER